MKKLNRQTVPNLPIRPVKIIQFGEGNFLRGFVDWMIDILNEKSNFNGDIQIVQPIEKGIGNMINFQEGLYHVLLEGLEKGEKIQKERLITSVKGVLNPYQDYSAFLRLAENPDLEFIVSNTTEAGITFDERDKGDHIVPNSFPAKLTSLLHHRYQHFTGNNSSGLSIIPCELIEKNGDVLRKIVLKYVDYWSLSNDFKSWIEKEIVFYNSLVDRIVPGFPRNSIGSIQKRLGYRDQLVVKAEPFHLWIIEGPIAIQNRLQLAEVELNVIFTNDLQPYRTRKVRILNGAHTAMVPIAYLNGFTEVKTAIEDEKIGSFIKELIFDEIIPTIDMPKQDLEMYAHEVLNRFRNPFIKHSLMDISLNSISKFKVRVLPSILNYVEKQGNVPERLVTTFAYLIVFYSGQFNLKVVELRDDKRVIEFFKEAWSQTDFENITDKILSQKQLWGLDLTCVKNLKNTIIDKLRDISS